jgi:NADP-dependent aldehyde dehydrogenase
MTGGLPNAGTGFRAHDPAQSKEIDPWFAIASEADVAAACSEADAAFDIFKDSDPQKRAEFLDRIADMIDARRTAIVERAMLESGLPEARLVGETGRTTGQLRLFAAIVREGRWAGVTLDSPQPDRLPAPRSDLRQRRVGIGPVAVFGASNFPLAFSTAGGDTASALAAGCPVVVKGHPAHPGTAALVAGAIAEAAAASALPAGVFSLLQGPANSLGAALVRDPRIQAVGFTGSRSGGLALTALANGRAQPIPVYAEMSSINPVVLLPAALASSAEILGEAYVASLTLGAGQFCTNPGLILAIDDPALDRFVAAAADKLREAPTQVMLTPAICDRYASDVERLTANAAARLIARGNAGTAPGHGCAALFEVGARDWLADPSLADEIFGAASIVVRAASMAELTALLASLEGQLTATLHFDAGDVDAARTLLPLLERKAGRILGNGWPTGVEVCRAMVHGGPFPASSDPRYTSVGAAAIERFLRPICYQDLPDALLPAAVRAANPLGLPRLVDGEAG